MTSWLNAADGSTRPSILPSAVRAAHDERIAVALEVIASAARMNSEHLAKLVSTFERFVVLVERLAERDERKRSK